MYNLFWCARAHTHINLTSETVVGVDDKSNRTTITPGDHRCQTVATPWDIKDGVNKFHVNKYDIIKTVLIFYMERYSISNYEKI